MSKPHIHTFGDLKEAGYKAISIKDEMRANLIRHLRNKTSTFDGIIGYEDSVIPDTERAILSRHNILYLGLRGQAKTRMARQMVDLLDEWMPIISGSDINDDPFKPISKYGRDLLATRGDDTPIDWVHRSERYGEKLATPDVTVADLIGDIDPIKAANLKLSFADEQVIHYGIIPRSNRSIFVINELPDLQARIQVALFNILQEGDIQIRGFKLRLPLDIQFIFTANPEDYTNRGSIVTPLKDRIESQILTHYPKTMEASLAITRQEARLPEAMEAKVQMHELTSKLIEQIAFEARSSEFVDKKSGVSARLTIAAFENAMSTAERRAILTGEKDTLVWISDFVGIVPAITGKVELVYEGEQEGPYQVAITLMEKAIRAIFLNYFPNPESLKKRNTGKKSVDQRKEAENPFQAVTQWFDQGNKVDLTVDLTDREKTNLLYKVEGLYGIVQRFAPQASEIENALFMEFVLHGMAAYSLISKKVIEGRVEFKDLMGSMFNFNSGSGEEGFDDLTEEDGF